MSLATFRTALIKSVAFLPERASISCSIPDMDNTVIIICSALLFISLAAQGEVTEAAPGQFIESRLILESDGGADIFLEAPVSIDDWALVPSTSPNVRQMALRIWASTDWQVTVSCDRPDGRMAEYDQAASRYVTGGRALENPLHVSSSWIDERPDPLEVELPGGGLIRHGGETSADGQRLLVALGQKVGWTDEPLDEGQAYRIALTFTISPTG
jgi:hypothetical protein